MHVHNTPACLFNENANHTEPLITNDDEPSNRRIPFRPGDIYNVIPGRLSFTVHKDDDHTISEIKRLPKLFFFSSDFQDRFEPFCAEFGPVKLSVVHRFCEFIHSHMSDLRLAERKLVYYCDLDGAACSNTAFLLGCYAMTHWEFTPEQADAAFSALSPSPFPAFRDASYHRPDYTLSLLDCFRGFQVGLSQGWYAKESFNAEAYEFWDHPANGDLHDITDKFIAFKGPEKERRTIVDGLRSQTPDDYISVLRDKGVTAVVRLNEPGSYDAARFRAGGLRHYDMFFDAQAPPPLSVVRAFFEVCDREQGRVAVHCRAGLGRTGTMIALWMMRRLGCSADAAVAWLRIVRPGSVLGTQHTWLRRCQHAFSHAFLHANLSEPLLPVRQESPACSPNGAANALELAGSAFGRGDGRLPLKRSRGPGSEELEEEESQDTDSEEEDGNSESSLE